MKDTVTIGCSELDDIRADLDYAATLLVFEIEGCFLGQ